MSTNRKDEVMAALGTVQDPDLHRDLVTLGMIEDLAVDGLKAKRDENQPYDTYEVAGKRTLFDGDWKKQKLSEHDYMKVFSTAEERYSHVLTTLLSQLKKTS